MHNHFEKHLNTRALIERFKPRLLVEAGCGRSTLQLRALQKEMGFRLVCLDVVYDPTHRGTCPFLPGVLTQVLPPGSDQVMELIYGISYLNFELFGNHSIDMAIVDTDHNGWTLRKELEVLERKMKPGGLVLLHDIETFRDINGLLDTGYESGESYPREEILAGPTMGEVVVEYKKKWTVIAETTESQGAIAFQIP